MAPDYRDNNAADLGRRHGVCFLLREMLLTADFVSST